MSDNVSVDAFKKSKPGRGCGQGAGRGYGRGRGGGRSGYQPRSQSGYCHTSSGQQGKCGNCGTHRILRDNVLRMDKTVTPVVRQVTTVDTVARSKDHQCLAEDPVERCTSLNQMKNTNTILSRSSAK